MKLHRTLTARLRLAGPILVLAGMLAAACAPSQPTPTPMDPTEVFQNALLTAAASYPTATYTPSPIPTETITPTPSSTPTSTPDPNRTPPALPGPHVSTLLKPVDTPHTYIEDTCEYLKNRWDPNNAAPGTVVMPIMFHSITKGEVNFNDQIAVDFFNQLMHDLKDQGFEAITTDQLVGFLEHNAKIPSRSVYLIVDDRKRYEYFDTHFKPYYESFGWPVVNAWISAVDTPDYLWKENEDLEQLGWVDHQAHGVVHNQPVGDSSPEDFIRSEMGGSIEAIQQHFNKTPVVYVWPGGGFSKKAAEIANELGYKLGFTVNPRGPLMYNWVPLADAADPGRPSFMAEGGVGNPLMVLPRYWDTDARWHIDTVRLVGKEAAEEADQNRAVELEYYDIICKSITGDIPAAP